MVQGWILLHRQIADHRHWLAEPFTRGQAWIDMLLLANHAPGHIRKRGVRIELKRGHLGWSHVELAKRWSWSRGKVKRFLNELENDHQIEQQITNVTTLIFITNYDKYQEQRAADSTANDTANGQQTGSKRAANGTGTKNENNGNNGNNGNNEKKSSSKFSDDDLSIAKNIFSAILKLNPEHKKPNMESWANEIRLMVERDGRTHEQITSLFMWANMDEFWSGNILSPGKLRKQWDKLVIQRNKSLTHKPGSASSQTKSNFQTMQEMYDDADDEEYQRWLNGGN